MNVEVALFDGVEALDALGPAEVLAYGRDAGADVEVALTSLDGERTVPTSHGIGVEADVSFPDDGGNLGPVDMELGFKPRISSLKRVVFLTKLERVAWKVISGAM